MTSSLHIGILRADDVIDQLANGYGQYPEMFEALLNKANQSRGNNKVALRFTNYSVNHGQYPEAIDEVDGYIITGSKSSVYDDVVWIKDLAEFTRQLHVRQKKCVGICFGHQMVAHALGGSAQKSAKGWGIGVRDTFANFEAIENYYLKGLETESYRLIYSHQDQVIQAPAGSAVLAGSEFCPIGIMALGQHILTFQGHPEFSTEFAKALYDFRRQAYPKELYDEAVASLEIEADRLIVANWMIDFLLP